MEKTCCSTKEKNHSTEFEKYTPRTFQLLNLMPTAENPKGPLKSFGMGFECLKKLAAVSFSFSMSAKLPQGNLSGKNFRNSRINPLPQKSNP